MKNFLLPLIIISLLITPLSFHGNHVVITPKSAFKNPRNGVAVLITGAAARLPQEAALLEELDKRGLLKNVVFISGVSSGAINSIMLNGILSGKMSWEEYRNILFAIRTEDVYLQNGKTMPVNSEPARALFKRIVEDSLGYYRMGDLPFCTGISFTHFKDLILEKTIYRMCSKKINQESDTTLSLVDIMMASSAFPLVFPPVRIKNVKTIPDVEYVDGGVGEDFVPYHALLEFEKHRGVGVEKVYIITCKNDSILETSEDFRAIGINDRGIFDKLDISIDAIFNKDIRKRLENYAAEAPELLPLTDIWIPEFKGEFLLFDFNNMKQQYDLASAWAKEHDPVPLNVYLEKKN